MAPFRSIGVTIAVSMRPNGADGGCAGWFAVSVIYRTLPGGEVVPHGGAAGRKLHISQDRMLADPANLAGPPAEDQPAARQLQTQRRELGGTHVASVYQVIGASWTPRYLLNTNR